MLVFTQNKQTFSDIPGNFLLPCPIFDPGPDPRYDVPPPPPLISICGIRKCKIPGNIWALLGPFLILDSGTIYPPAPHTHVPCTTLSRQTFTNKTANSPSCAKLPCYLFASMMLWA